jgi:hypothetical protein
LPVQGTALGLGLDRGRQISQVREGIAMRQEHVDKRGADPRVGRAEGVDGQHVQGPSGLRLLACQPRWASYGAPHATPPGQRLDSAWSTQDPGSPPAGSVN